MIANPSKFHALLITHSETSRVGRLHREKSHKNKNSESERVRMLCSAERIETIAVHCTFVMQIPREKNLQYFILFSNVLQTFSFTKPQEAQCIAVRGPSQVLTYECFLPIIHMTVISSFYFLFPCFWAIKYSASKKANHQ